jgi:hypothetical protein
MREKPATGTRSASWRQVRARLILVVLLLVLRSPDRSALAVQDTRAQSYHVDVGGYKLYLTCVGSGSPTVVFGGGFIERWARVQPVVGSFTRACAYDSAGMGMSGLGPLPVTVKDLSAQLHHLLSDAAIPGPYILVGEGVEGSSMRIYASRDARSMVGLILVDAIHPHYFSRANLQLFDNRDIDLKASREELLNAQSLGAMPLIVMSHGIHLSLSATVERSWTSYEHQFAGLSSGSVWVIANHSGYGIPVTQPQVVIEAVDQLLLAWKTHSPIRGCKYWLPSAGAFCPPR